MKMTEVTDAAIEAMDIQNEVERTLLPLTVDWRARYSLGAT
jgi:hypothetical protein